MLKSFLLSGAMRGYAVVVGVVLQLVLANTMTKEDFGSVNSFISAVLLTTFLLSAAATRQLVRDLGAYGADVCRKMVQSYINASHIYLVIAICIAIVAVVIGQTWSASFSLVIGVVFASAIYSAYFRGKGQYLIGNLEANLLRSTCFLGLLCLAAPYYQKISVENAQVLYVIASTFGLALLVFMRGVIQPLDLRVLALWPFGGLPITMTILAGLEIFIVNFDLVIINLLYGPEIAAEVRIGHQLRSLATLPLQIYLMFSLNRLSHSILTRANLSDRRRELVLIRLMLSVCVLFVLLISEPFGHLFFKGGVETLLLCSIMSGVVPLIVFGPRTDLTIAAATEGREHIKTLIFLAFYVGLTPSLIWASGLAPMYYFSAQAIGVAVYFLSLHRTI